MIPLQPAVGKNTAQLRFVDRVFFRIVADLPERTCAMPFVCPVVPSPETSLLRSARRAGVMQVLVFAVTFLVAVAPHRSSAQAQAHTSNPINSASWGALPTSAQVRVSSAIGNDRRQYYFVSQPGSFSA